MKTAIIIINSLFMFLVIHFSFTRGFKAGCEYTEKMNKNANSTLQNEEISK